MTNAEKFKEVFGFEPLFDSCIAPVKVCEHHSDSHFSCEDCTFDKWWSKEYKPCFVLAKEFE